MHISQRFRFADANVLPIIYLCKHYGIFFAKEAVQHGAFSFPYSILKDIITLHMGKEEIKKGQSPLSKTDLILQYLTTLSMKDICHFTL